MPDATCPSWCDQIQCQEPLEADRVHQHLELLPVIYRDADMQPIAGPLIILVVSTKLQVTDEVWVTLELGEDQPVASLTLSLESALRLQAHLTRLLGQL
ncbi:hypothetical protein [Microbacterium sp. NPDC077184]|uniref:hypothetical protein n=1 Tax=Microbacterium sp. NPDC077184 TaxID=3154764 RepID=UPI003416B6C7